MVFGDIRRIELRKDRDLLDDIFDLIFSVLDVNHLDGNGLTCTLVEPGWSCGQLGCHRGFSNPTKRETDPLYTFPKLPPPMQFCFVYRVSGSTEPEGAVAAITVALRSVPGYRVVAKTFPNQFNLMSR
jgi:hypothetical protein